MDSPSPAVAGERAGPLVARAGRARRGRDVAAADTPGPRLALLVVLGLVLVGTTLTGALATWSAEVVASAGASLLGGGTLAVLGGLVGVAWRTSGRHAAVPAVAMSGAAAAYALAWLVPAQPLGLAEVAADGTALAVGIAGLLTAVVTAGLAAHRRAVCQVLSGRAT